MKKVFGWIGVILLSPILLFIIISILLYIPSVQNFAVRNIASYASDKTKLDIHINHISLVFPLDLGINGIKVIQQNDSLPQVKDTVADIKSIKLNVQLIPLFHNDVEINKFEISKAKINTTNFVRRVRVKGFIDYLSANSHGIKLDDKVMIVNHLYLSGARLTVELSDTVPKDTTKTENKWKIIAEKANINKTDITIHTPGDTLQVRARIGALTLLGGTFDLGKGLYSVRQFDIMAGVINYDNNFEPRMKGLDYNHIALSEVNIGIDTLSYYNSSLNMALRTCSFVEKSGIRIKELKGRMALDSTSVHLPLLELRTPDSDIFAELVFDKNTFDKKNPGRMFVHLMATIGKQDIMRFCGMMPQQFVKRYPNRPLTIRGSITGNMKAIDFTGLDINLPTAFHAKAKGIVKNPTDLKHINAHINMQAESYDLGFVTCMIDKSIMNQYKVPRGIKVDGDFDINGSKYSADFTAREGKGVVKGYGNFDRNAMSYAASLKITELQLHDFMPYDSLYAFTGEVEVKGKGTDFMSGNSRLNASANIKKLQYGHWNLDKVNFSATLNNGVAHADIKSKNPVLDGIITVDALLNKKNIELTFSADLRKADLYRLRLLDRPFNMSMCAHLDFSTNLKDRHSLSGTISDMTIITDTTTFRPSDVVINMLANRDTTFAQLLSDNFELNLNSSDGYQTIIDKGLRFSKVLMHQLKNKRIDQIALRNLLPDVNLYIMSGNENPFSNIMSIYGFKFNDLLIDMTSSPAKGLNGKIHIYSLNANKTQIDTVNISIYQDTTQVKFEGQVKNGINNPQFVFDARFNGYILEKGAGLNLKYFDSEGKMGVMLGFEATLEDKGLRFHLSPARPVLGYKEFNLNQNNYVYLGNDMKVEANVDLIADDGTGIKISSTPNEEALQDMTVSVNKFDLEKIMSVLPYMPRMTGSLNGDFHFIQTKDQLSVMSDLSVGNMTYNNSPIGNISSEFVYLPKNDGSHHVDGRLMLNNKEVMTIVGSYKSAGEGYIDARLGMDRFPLQMINGFIPDHLIGFKGYGEGSMDIKGSPKTPQVNGEVYLDSAYLTSESYGVTLKFDNDPVRIVGSNLLLENFGMYAHNDNPLNIHGNVDFSNLDKVSVNLRMRADDYLLIDAKRTRRSLIYGKMYADYMGYIRGNLDDLQMKGQLKVLGNTDITYILKDSPLTTGDQLKELVTFTDFKDTTRANVVKPPLRGLSMDMSVDVEEGARVMCDLNTDHSNYVNLEGGGNLRMLYNTTDNLRLIGRYTLNNGEMKYALPIIPLKILTIQSGSYIEFSGDPMNPKLNLSATERMNALVSSQSETNRSVAFDVGVKLTQTLQHMGLEFALDAPEDMSVKNELAAMSTERRSKLAVTMLTTGMYMSDGNTNSFSMTSAINSFLQSEISNITGNALKSIDLTFGMDKNTGSNGNLHTDYSFKFAKRFWNNRLSIVIGGKVSSAAETNNENQSLIDNVSFQYRLDQTAMRYIKLFYNKNSNDLLEGRITEYGGGVVLRKKMSNITELFDFRKGKNVITPLLPDSMKK